MARLLLVRAQSIFHASESCPELFCKHRMKAWTCCLTGTQAINLLALTSLGACSPGVCRVSYVCPEQALGVSLPTSPGQGLPLET